MKLEMCAAGETFLKQGVLEWLICPLGSCEDSSTSASSCSLPPCHMSGSPTNLARRSFWRECYAVLYDSRLLLYENEQSRHHQLASGILYSISLAQNFPAIIYGKACESMFQLSIASTEIILFRVQSLEDRKSWIDAIRRVAFRKGMASTSETHEFEQKNGRSIANQETNRIVKSTSSLAEMMFISRLSQIQSERLHSQMSCLGSSPKAMNACDQTNRSWMFWKSRHNSTEHTSDSNKKMLLGRIGKACNRRSNDQKATFPLHKASLSSTGDSYTSNLENLATSCNVSREEPASSSNRRNRRPSFLKAFFSWTNPFEKKDFKEQPLPLLVKDAKFDQSLSGMVHRGMRKESSMGNFGDIDPGSLDDMASSIKKAYSATQIQYYALDDWKMGKLAKSPSKPLNTKLAVPLFTDASTIYANLDYLDPPCEEMGLFSPANELSSERCDGFVNGSIKSRSATPLVEGIMPVYDFERHCWRRRHCSIEEGMFLVRKHHRPCGSILYSLCVLFAQVSRLSLSKRDYCIEITIPPKRLVFQAANGVIQNRWIEIIRLAAIDAIKYRPSTEISVRCQYQSQFRTFYVSRNIAFSAFLSFLKFEFGISKFCHLCYRDVVGNYIPVSNQTDLDVAFLECDEDCSIWFCLSMDEIFLNDFRTLTSQQPERGVPQRTQVGTPNSTGLSTMVLETYNFVFGEIIGRGACSVVRSALNPETGEMVAVKQVRILGGQRNARRHLELLKKEIEVLKHLDHPNIVRYLGVDQDGDCLNVFLELVGGGTLQTVIREYGPFDEVLIRRYTRQIGMGLKYLHDHGIIHRDIKSANILVETHGSAKLADFGTAIRLLNGERTNELCGTPYWMAPEVIRQEAYGKPADIWSLACTIIEMSTKRPPWHEFTEHLSAMYHIATTTDLPEIPTWLSNDAHYLLCRCFERDPAKRPSIDEILGFSFLLGDINPKELASYRHPERLFKSRSREEDIGQVLNNLEQSISSLEIAQSEQEDESNSDSLFLYDVTKFPPYLRDDVPIETSLCETSDPSNISPAILLGELHSTLFSQDGNSLQSSSKLPQMCCSLSDHLNGHELQCRPSNQEISPKASIVTSNEYI